MRIIADLHCHTHASIHAYSSLRENIEAARRSGLSALAITDHGIGCEDSPPDSYFQNLTSLPRYVDGLLLLRGVEANIMDFNGELDMPESTLDLLDIVIASFHTNCVLSGTVEQHTDAYLAIARNPIVHIIGHCGSAEFLFDYERVIPVWKQYRKVVEFNAHTFICRKEAIPNCRQIALLCKKYELPVVINSDAHSEFELAQCDAVYQMLNDIDFPESLILNIDRDRICRYFKSIGIQI